MGGSTVTLWALCVSLPLSQQRLSCHLFPPFPFSPFPPSLLAGPSVPWLGGKLSPGLADLLCQREHDRGRSLVRQHSSLLKQGCLLLRGGKDELVLAKSSWRAQPLARAVRPGMRAQGLCHGPRHPAPTRELPNPGSAACFGSQSVCAGFGPRRARPWE